MSYNTQFEKIFIGSIFLVFVFSVVFAELESKSRKLKVEINHNCRLHDGTNCSSWTNKTLLHIRSDSMNDSIHFIWTFIGSPSLLLARTSPQTNLTVNWDSLFQETPGNKSISFVGPRPYYTFAYSISQVLIYEDPKDRVKIDAVNSSTIQAFNTKDFIWERNDKQSKLNSSYIDVPFVAVQYKNHTLGPGGYFKYKVKSRDTDGYSDVLPYMLHNMNMTQTDISFSQVQMNYPEPNPKDIRVAFTLLLVQGLEENSPNNSSKPMRLEAIKSLDDEHTPGVFETINIRTPVLGTYDQSFIQWKPISYTGEVRDITDSVDVSQYDIKNQNIACGQNYNETLDTSLLWTYYGDDLCSLSVYGTNVSFGSRKDGFYTKTPHISWTFMTGFGTPPEDYVSPMVVLVISIGLGIPAFIILGSVIFLVIKKMAKNQDDLLLGAP